MEKLSLKKFEDYELNNSKMKSLNGSQGSSHRDVCSTGSSFLDRDTHTDIYSDPCGDGQYDFICTVKKSNSAFGHIHGYGVTC